MLLWGVQLYAQPLKDFVGMYYVILAAGPGSVGDIHLAHNSYALLLLA